MQVIVIMRLEKYQLRTYLIGESSPSKVQPHQNKEKKQKNTFLKKTILKKIHNAGFRSETALGNAGFRPGLKLRDVTQFQTCILALVRRFYIKNCYSNAVSDLTPALGSAVSYRPQA